MRTTWLRAAVFLMGLGLLTGQRAMADSSRAFADLQAHWAAAAVTEAAAIGMVHGYPDHLFHPDAPVTRVEFVAMLEFSPFPAMAEGVAVPFPDMKDHWATRAGYLPVALRKHEIRPEEYGDGTFGRGGNFNPDQPITRLEMAVLTARKMVADKGDRSNLDVSGAAPVPFEDMGGLAERTRQLVAICTMNGVLRGYPDGTFRPGRTASRAEAVSTLLRAAHAVARAYTPPLPP